jgi:hypothetical protein
MKKLSKEQIIEKIEDGIKELKDILSDTVIENEQERIIRKNRIIAKLERENEILRIKLEEKNNTLPK